MKHSKRHFSFVKLLKVLTYDAIKLKGFPNSLDVMLFFQPECKFTFSCSKFSFKHWSWKFQNFAR